MSENRSNKSNKFLGMTAAQRAFLSVILFFIVLLFGVSLLLATGRIAI